MAGSGFVPPVAREEHQRDAEKPGLFPCGPAGLAAAAPKLCRGAGESLLGGPGQGTLKCLDVFGKDEDLQGLGPGCHGAELCTPWQ